MVKLCDGYILCHWCHSCLILICVYFDIFSRPESQQPEVPEVTDKTIKPLNLVLLGNEGLATEFYKEIRVCLV